MCCDLRSCSLPLLLLKLQEGEDEEFEGESPLKLAASQRSIPVNVCHHERQHRGMPGWVDKLDTQQQHSLHWVLVFSRGGFQSEFETANLRLFVACLLLLFRVTASNFSTQLTGSTQDTCVFVSCQSHEL